MRLKAAGRGRRLPPALIASLLAHALLLSLSFGQGDGLPGLELPWHQRRAEAAELRVQLQPLPAPPAAVLAPAAEAEAPADAAPSVQAEPSAEPDAADTSTTEVRLTDTAEPPPAPPARALIAVERARPEHWTVLTDPALPTAAIATMPSASSPALEPLARARESLRPREDRSAEPAQLAMLRAEAAIAALDAASAPAVEPLRRTGSGLRLDKRTDSTVLDAAAAARVLPSAAVATLVATAASAPAVQALSRAGTGLRPATSGNRAGELAQLGAAVQQAQQGAQQLETARQEALRQEAARAEAARAEAQRQEAARAEAARQEAARLAAAQLAAAKAQVQVEEEQREARKRAIGRQLDEEAARRDAERQRPDWAPARRGRLFGRVDSHAALAAYGEAWVRKIEQNVTPEVARDLARQPHTQAMVTVAVRSNGSVESITFVRSSGVPAVDDAIRRIVQSQENYPAFAPALLRDYDVVEIRRTWQFDSAVRLY